ncbi:hypothetical protein SAPIO_CDS1105 [Scedosporium apiospermum]|uniref:Uncharacterized protein n=1 Tax=Pseudallescheria apiosperma TaxID=563466 RepID=A0A084GFV7_PSEDA|nr:uncharacterized protein SAPIO_CDS1105 [Scedosporium apiospermum]KEZ46219.1 hypothetical protein SAPIO_CDS1105 [Scedosporium apiospermum]
MRGRSRSRERDDCPDCAGAGRSRPPQRSMSGARSPPPPERLPSPPRDYDAPRERTRSLSPGPIHRAWHRLWHPHHHHHHHHHHNPPYYEPQYPPPPPPLKNPGPFTLQVHDRTADDPRPHNPHGRSFTITVTPDTRPCDIIFSLAPPRSRCLVLVCSTFQPAYVMPKDVSLPEIANMRCWLEIVDG